MLEYYNERLLLYFNFKLKNKLNRFINNLIKWFLYPQVGLHKLMKIWIE